MFLGPYQNEIYPLDEEIRFVGDTVAAVAARDWNVAEEAIRSASRHLRGFARGPRSRSGVQPGAPGAVLTILKVMSSSPATSGPTSLELWATSSD